MNNEALERELFSREAKAERSRLRAAMLAVRYLRKNNDNAWQLPALPPSDVAADTQRVKKAPDVPGLQVTKHPGIKVP
jgi:hypothetical protein